MRWTWLVVWVLELGIAAAAVWAIRKALLAAAQGGSDGGADAAETLERHVVELLGNGLHSQLIAMEMATIYYALFAPRKPAPEPAAPHGTRPVTPRFSRGQAGAGAVFLGLVLAVVVEAVALHVWISPSYPTAALVLTALSGYSLLWLLGHHRATELRPVLVVGDVLLLRAGLRLTARVSRDVVESVEAITWREVPSPSPGYLDTAQPLSPNLLLTFARPTVVTVAFGVPRTITRIGLLLDDPAAFVRAVNGTQT